jgi:predicted lipoprotein with Yx(FWY)xxD motif
MKPRLAGTAAAVLFASILASAPVFAAQPKAANGMFVDDSGMTLYTFDKDPASGPSACTGGCAQAWPAAAATGADKATGEWGMADADGGKQWTYEGHRLYRFVKDQKPGDTNGDNFKNVWHIAKP